MLAPDGLNQQGHKGEAHAAELLFPPQRTGNISRQGRVLPPLEDGLQPGPVLPRLRGGNRVDRGPPLRALRQLLARHRRLRVLRLLAHQQGALLLQHQITFFRQGVHAKPQCHITMGLGRVLRAAYQQGEGVLILLPAGTDAQHAHGGPGIFLQLRPLLLGQWNIRLPAQKPPAINRPQGFQFFLGHGFPRQDTPRPFLQGGITGHRHLLEPPVSFRPPVRHISSVEIPTMPYCIL